MSNLLLITDVARLRKLFGRLTEDRNLRLRVVNNLEKGGEEIAIEKPDVVFVQTHLSGLSADILIMHLKKQLGRKRSRFVLLASPAQTNDAILKPYQGWLDTSTEDSQLLSDLQHLLAKLMSKPKKIGEPAAPEPIASADFKQQPVVNAESPALPGVPPAYESDPQQQVVAPVTPETSLEEQGLTYAPRPRLKVYSEFNSSFDSAVGRTAEPEPLEQAIPALTQNWNVESIETVETKPERSKKGAFLLWLLPVVVAVVAITYLQQQGPAAKPEPARAKTTPAAVVPPAAQTPPPSPPAPVPAKAPAATNAVLPAVPQEQDRMSDKAVLTAISEKRELKVPSVPVSTVARPTTLPKFVPSNGLDKKYGAANPGWELYMGNVTEFRVLRDAQAIKAIQVIDRGWRGVSEPFMKRALHQVTNNRTFSIYTSEKKEGYVIQRGKIADNIRVVYYRDERGGKLRAFVLTWQ